MKISIDQLKALSPGDVCETGGLFPGINKEACAWEYLGSLAGIAQFRVSYMGVPISHMNGKVVGDKITWTKVNTDA